MEARLRRPAQAAISFLYGPVPEPVAWSESRYCIYSWVLHDYDWLEEKE